MTTKLTLTVSGKTYTAQGKTASGQALSMEVTEELTPHVDALVQALESLDETAIKAKEDQIVQKEQIIITLLPTIAEYGSDEAIHAVKEHWGEWGKWIDQTVPKNTILQHEGLLYRVRQEHFVQGHYPPSIDTAALYLMIVPPDEEGQILPWEDRHGMGKELYKTGDVVTHAGFFWTSRVDNNHLEPTETNWAAWTKGDPIY